MIFFFKTGLHNVPANHWAFNTLAAAAIAADASCTLWHSDEVMILEIFMLALSQTKFTIVLVFIHFFETATGQTYIVIKTSIRSIKLIAYLFRFRIGMKINHSILSHIFNILHVL